MSRAVMKSKWKSHGSFRSQRKAEKCFELLEKMFPDGKFTILIRRWADKDKKRYQVKELVRKGTKK